MGLSGRKLKQRIPDDPRNLSWADNAARFGSSYLAKFGWDASQGLGATGDGRLSHIKVSQKLDMLGIGAANSRDPDGIAWKQNKDFENLLKRLNDSVASDNQTLDKVETLVESEGITVKKRRKRDESGEPGEEETRKKKKMKSRKHDKGEDSGKRKKRESALLDADGKKERSKHIQNSGQEDVTIAQVSVQPSTIPSKPTGIVVPRHRAHRARAIAAKSIASKSNTAISEILGISCSNTPSGTGTPSGMLTSLDDDNNISVEVLKTSTKSVADYFKEKLVNKTLISRIPQLQVEEAYTDDDLMPRRGLGSTSTHDEVSKSVDQATELMSFSKFSSLMSSSFLTATMTSSSNDSPGNVEVSSDNPQESERSTASLDKDEKRKKKKAKKEREQSKKEKTKKDYREGGDGGG